MGLQRALLTVALPFVLANNHVRDSTGETVIERDVAIIGGGASGTFAATRFKDSGISFVIIEEKSNLGGHVDTWTEPKTGKPFNAGVQSYWDWGPAREFFQRFGVEVAPLPPQGNTTDVFFDLDTGEVVQHQAPDPSDFGAAFGIYLNQTKKYSDILLPGFWNFPSGDDIPPDLLMPFGEFAAKYKLESLVEIMYFVSGVGATGIRDIPTFEVMGPGFSQVAVECMATNKAFGPKSGSNMELYEKALEEFKADVFLNSRVVRTVRSSHGVEIVTVDDSGKCTRIKAKQLLITIQPDPQNLGFLDTEPSELEVFDTFQRRWLYDASVRAPEMPGGTNLLSINPAAAPNDYLSMYETPTNLMIRSQGFDEQDLYWVILEANHSITPDEAKQVIRDAYVKLVQAGSLGTDVKEREDEDYGFEVVTLGVHNGVLWRQSAETLKEGIVQKVMAVQGQKSTWWTGVIWCSDFSSPIWKFTDGIVDRIKSSLSEPRVYPPIEGRQPSVAISPSLVESVAGFTAGVVSTLAVHPFDVIKTRLQIEQNERSRPGGTLRVIRQIASEAVRGTTPEMSKAMHTGRAKSADLLRSFYRGLMPNMIGNSVSWALYFMWYGNIKDLVRAARHSSTGSRQLHSSDYFVASGVSGILTAVLTNPIWVIKTRMLSTAKHAPGAYTSIAQGASSLYRAEGIRGFYRGLLPSLFGVSHGAIQFMAYEQLKNRWGAHRKGGKEGLTNLDYLQLSAVSKMFAGSMTYPYQVVRARLQTYDASKKYKGAWDVVRQVFRNEGVVGFYKGLAPNLVRVLPSTCVTFLVYENVKFYLPRMLVDDEISEP